MKLFAYNLGGAYSILAESSLGSAMMGVKAQLVLWGAGQSWAWVFINQRGGSLELGKRPGSWLLGAGAVIIGAG